MHVRLCPNALPSRPPTARLDLAGLQVGGLLPRLHVRLLLRRLQLAGLAPRGRLLLLRQQHLAGLHLLIATPRCGLQQHSTGLKCVAAGQLALHAGQLLRLLAALLRHQALPRHLACRCG